MKDFAIKMPHLVHFATEANLWVLFFAGITTVVMSIWAIFAIAQSVTGSDVIAKRVLLRNRRRTICKMLKEFGIPRSKLRLANEKISKKAVRSGAEPSIQQEIEWLSKLAIEFDAEWSGPLELNGLTSSDAPEEQLFKLSKAYEEFSKSLRAQSILFSSALMQPPIWPDT